jgi:cell division protein FtsB
MALAALTVFGYLAFRPAPRYAEERSVLRQRRDTLVAEMAMLDIRFESRAIGEQTHRRQRGLLKRELKEILHHLGTAVP